MISRKVFLFSIVILAGCASQQKVDTLKTTSRVDADAISSRAASEFSRTAKIRADDDFISRIETPILTGRTMPVKRDLPEVFHRDFFFNPTGERRLVDVIKSLSSSTGLVVTARDDVYNPTATKISSTDAQGNVDAAAVQLANTVRTEGNLQVADRVKLPAGSRYSGTVEGFLDYVTSVLNVSWTYLHDDGRVLLTRYVESSYRLFVPPVGQGSNGEANIWADTKTTLEGFLSQGGSVSINQQAGLVTVVDTRDVQEMVKAHIRRVNQSLQRSVVLSVEVLSVRTTDTESEGFTLDAVHQAAETSLSISGGGVSIPAAGSFRASLLDGPFSGSQILQQNLATKGEVSVALQRIIRTMNNQSAKVENIDTVPVISSYTPPIVANGSTTPGGVALTNLEVGFTLDVTPAIMDDGQNMVLRFNLSNSSLDSIRDIPVGGDGQIVQSARTSKRSYDHTFSMKNAETIVVSGFYDKLNDFKQSGPLSGWLSWLFGSKTDTAERIYYVILLTPEIGNGSNITL